MMILVYWFNDCVNGVVVKRISVVFFGWRLI